MRCPFIAKCGPPQYEVPLGSVGKWTDDGAGGTGAAGTGAELEARIPNPEVPEPKLHQSKMGTLYKAGDALLYSDIDADDSKHATLRKSSPKYINLRADDDADDADDAICVKETAIDGAHEHQLYLYDKPEGTGGLRPPDDDDDGAYAYLSASPPPGGGDTPSLYHPSEVRPPLGAGSFHRGWDSTLTLVLSKTPNSNMTERRSLPTLNLSRPSTRSHSLDLTMSTHILRSTFASPPRRCYPVSWSVRWIYELCYIIGGVP